MDREDVETVDEVVEKSRSERTKPSTSHKFMRSIRNNSFIKKCGIILIICFVVYLVAAMNVNMDEIVQQYDSLTAKTNNSKTAFDKRLFYITYDEEGNKKVVVGFASEVDKLAAENAGLIATPLDFSIYTDGEIYDKLASSEYADKANTLAIVYGKAIENGYNEEFAVGLMANIIAEGNVGYIEEIWCNKTQLSGSKKQYQLSCSHGIGGSWTYSYWTKVNCSVHQVTGETVNASNIDILMSIGGDVSGIGVGMCQWSGGRRHGLLKKYKETCVTYSYEELLSAELDWIFDELSSGYKYVANECTGKTASECAYIISIKYERPAGGTSSATARAETANKIVNILTK